MIKFLQILLGINLGTLICTSCFGQLEVFDFTDKNHIDLSTNIHRIIEIEYKDIRRLKPFVEKDTVLFFNDRAIESVVLSRSIEVFDSDTSSVTKRHSAHSNRIQVIRKKFNREGSLLLKSIGQETDNEFIFKERLTYKYDLGGRLTEVFKNDRLQTSISYRENGLVNHLSKNNEVSKIDVQSIRIGDTIHYTVIKKFDIFGRRDTVYEYYEFSQDSIKRTWFVKYRGIERPYLVKEYFTRLFVYDINWNLRESMYYDPQNVLIGHQTVAYHENGSIVETNNLFLKRRNTYVYDKNGHLLHEPHGEMSWNYEYDIKGNWIFRIYISDGGAIVPEIKIRKIDYK